MATLNEWEGSTTGTLNPPASPARAWNLPAIAARPWRQLEEYWPTLATEFTVILAQIVAYKLAAHFLGKNGFAEYAVARRAATLISPLPLLGLAVGLPRYIAYSLGQQSMGQSNIGQQSLTRSDAPAAARYYGATLRCVVCALILCLAALNFLNQQFAFLFFGDRAYAPLIFPVSLMVLGLCLHSVVYSYFRGHLAMRRANLLQLINLAGIPIFCFATLHQSAARLIFSLGLLWSVVAFAALCFTPVQEFVRPARGETRELLRYGVPRLPGEFALMALLALPVILVAHRSGVQQAGFVAFGISVLSMIGGIFAPLGLILLPKASSLLASGKTAELRVHVARLVRVSVAIAAVATVLVCALAHPLVRIYLGEGFDQAAVALQLIVLGAIPYALFTVLRNLIDAFHRDAVTAVITACGFAVFALAAWLGRGHMVAGREVLFAFLLALVTLGGAALIECGRILRA